MFWICVSYLCLCLCVFVFYSLVGRLRPGKRHMREHIVVDPMHNGLFAQFDDSVSK